MSIDTWLLYAAAVLVLSVTPGPCVLMSITNGVNHGVRGAACGAFGSVLAIFGIMACSAAGVGAVLAASESLFQAVKWLGAAYLVYIGVTTFRSNASSFDVPEAGGARARSRRSLFVQGVLVGGSNPKAILFFTALFPQFIDPRADPWVQFAVLSGTYVVCELFWLMFYAAFAARVGPWLRAQGRARMFNRLSGATFVGAGLLLATVRRSAP